MVPGPWGGRGAMGMPVQKAKDFQATFQRLLGYFLVQKYQLFIVIATSILSTVFYIIGPKILGLATSKLFEGLLLKFKRVPGATIDFVFISHILLLLAGLYVIGAVFGYLQQYIMASVAQKTVYTLRHVYH